MRLSSILIRLSVFFILFSASTQAQQKFSLTASKRSFFPKKVETANFKTYTLTVPENWMQNSGKIELPVVVIPGYVKTDNYTFFIPGGPGGWSLGALQRWVAHPLRKNSNIVLMDLRGTGFASPKFCPNLSDGLFEILSKDLAPAAEQKLIVKTASECLDSIELKGIDPKQYNSSNIISDIESLRQALKISKWNIYGVSYGTHIAKLYANQFPEETRSLILDSPIDNIADYYTYNTKNFFTALEKVFKNSEKAFPATRQKYIAVINSLSKKALTVEAPKRLSSKGIHFSFNKQDFQLVLHQSLYNDKLIVLIPYIIDAFYKHDNVILARLAQQFSGNLKRDFGTYYCVTCNDTYSAKSLENYNNSAAAYQELGGPVNFYQSDLNVCQSWELNNKNNAYDQALTDNHLNNGKLKVLIFAGEYDPITPLSNGESLSKKIPNSILVKMPGGHSSSFNDKGGLILSDFVRSPGNFVYHQSSREIYFAKQLLPNKGIYNIALDLKKPNFIFLSPTLISLLVLLFSIVFLIKRFSKSRYLHTSLLITSLSGLVATGALVYAILKTSQININLILFGLSNHFGYCIYLIYFFIACTVLSLLHFIFSYKRLTSKEIYLILLICDVYIIAYLWYWGVV